MSGFEPFDTGLVTQRLREQVSGLHSVGGAADYAAVKELAGFRAPSGYVIFAEERNTGKVPTAPCTTIQDSEVQFGVVLALRHYKELRGEQMHQEARALIGAVRAALIGWRPPAQGARVVTWLSGKVLDYDAGVLLYADLYQLPYMLSKE